MSTTFTSTGSARYCSFPDASVTTAMCPLESQPINCENNGDIGAGTYLTLIHFQSNAAMRLTMVRA
jgi:hypothetical protein